MYYELFAFFSSFPAGAGVSEQGGRPPTRGLASVGGPPAPPQRGHVPRVRGLPGDPWAQVASGGTFTSPPTCSGRHFTCLLLCRLERISCPKEKSAASRDLKTVTRARVTCHWRAAVGEAGARLPWCTGAAEKATHTCEQLPEGPVSTQPWTNGPVPQSGNGTRDSPRPPPPFTQQLGYQLTANPQSPAVNCYFPVLGKERRPGPNSENRV